MDDYFDNLHPELKAYLKLVSPNFPDFLIPYLATKTLQRLKDVGYFCGMDYASKSIYNFKFYLSRLDHSLSTALMVWQFTKDKKATLAALFHDASTPVFSHVIDFMNGDTIIQESTEIDLNNFLKKDLKLIRLLKNDGLTLSDISDYKQYPLVDNKRPKLCADRLDGIFITSLTWIKNITIAEIKELYADVIVTTNEERELEYGFRTSATAQRIIELNHYIDEFFHSDEDTYMMNLLAKITKYLIEKSILEYNDLFVINEAQAFDIIENRVKVDQNLAELYQEFKKAHEVKLKNKLPIKKRIIDPLVNGIRYSKL